MRGQIHHEQPFAQGAAVHYFFATPALRLRLDLAREYVRAGGSPISIIGEAGAGKSAFLHQLLAHADHHWHIVRIPAVATFSANDVMRFVSAELRLPVRATTDEMLRELDRWLERASVRGQIAVIAVDNAHLLSDESLIQLTSLPESLRLGDCRVLLSGEPCLQHRLKKLSAQSRAAASGHVINIPSLDRREVASYIDMKLYHAGMEGRGPFSRLVIERIARNSNGHPGRIDEMASAFLNGGHRGTHWRRASGRLQRIIRRLSALRDLPHP